MNETQDNEFVKREYLDSHNGERVTVDVLAMAEALARLQAKEQDDEQHAVAVVTFFNALSAFVPTLLKIFEPLAVVNDHTQRISALEQTVEQQAKRIEALERTLNGIADKMFIRVKGE